MVRIPASELAREIIDDCLSYGTWPMRALDALVERALDESDEAAAHAATQALFGVIVERLADLFEPALCDVYAQLFSRVITRVLPDFDTSDLLMRYGRIRRTRPFSGGKLQRVFVLSRITLGADVAVTSVVLAAAKRRFPDAEICFVGPDKNAALFAGDEDVTPVPVDYGRSSNLRDRMLAALELHSVVDEVGSIVLDPDSRLTQLGLIPVCDDSRYYFFESRAYGGASELSLPQLTSLWAEEVLNVNDCKPYLSPQAQDNSCDYTVSFGVGENADKRLGKDAEERLLRALLAHGHKVLLDAGVGAAENERAAELQRTFRDSALQVHHGPYASFASHIIQSRFYLGYDSAGQHVAAATGVPLLSLFAGFPCRRMFCRWRPEGTDATVLEIADVRDAEPVVQEALSRISALQ